MLFAVFKSFFDNSEIIFKNYSLIFVEAYEKKTKQIFSQALCIQYHHDAGTGMADYKCAFCVC